MILNCDEMTEKSKKKKFNVLKKQILRKREREKKIIIRTRRIFSDLKTLIVW